MFRCFSCGLTCNFQTKKYMNYTSPCQACAYMDAYSLPEQCATCMDWEGHCNFKDKDELLYNSKENDHEEQS